MLERSERRSVALRGRAGRGPGLLLVLVVAGVKLWAYAPFLLHPGRLIVLLAAGLVASVLRPKPLVIAAMAAALFALVVAVHPVALGVAVGVGAFVVLMTLFFALATVLHARQREPG